MSVVTKASRARKTCWRPTSAPLGAKAWRSSTTELPHPHGPSCVAASACAQSTRRAAPPIPHHATRTTGVASSSPSSTCREGVFIGPLPKQSAHRSPPCDNRGAAPPCRSPSMSAGEWGRAPISIPSTPSPPNAILYGELCHAPCRPRPPPSPRAHAIVPLTPPLPHCPVWQRTQPMVAASSASASRREGWPTGPLPPTP